MKITLLSFGSWGDVAPLIPLAQELKRRGHTPCIVSNADFVEAVDQYDVDYQHVGIHIQELLTTEHGTLLMQSRSASKSLKILFTLIQSQLVDIAKRLETMLKDTDLLIVNERYFLLADSLAEHHGFPIMQICFQPKGSTATYPYLYYRAWYFRWLTNKNTHLLMEKTLLKHMLPSINHIRKTSLQMPSLSIKEAYQRKSKSPLIQCFSRHIFYPPKDWKNNTAVVGNLYVKDKKSAIPTDLLNFLSKTDVPVIYVGFGSMLYDAIRLQQQLTEVIQRIKIKFVWSLNWSDTSIIAHGLLTESIYVIKELPHDSLFPWVDGVIHHGGSGTTATALRNAKPQLVIWFMLDQEFWARSVEKCSLGINLGNFHRLSSKRLVDAINKLMQSKIYRSKASEASKDMALENAAVEASNFIEKTMY